MSVDAPGPGPKDTTSPVDQPAPDLQDMASLPPAEAETTAAPATEPETALPVDDQARLYPQEEPHDLRPTNPEADKTPESPERIEKTRAALEKLIGAAGEYAHRHDRAGDNEDLAQIDLRVPVEGGGAYHLAVGFLRSNPGDNLMLSLETPGGGSSNPWANLTDVGTYADRRKIQDFLYRQDASTVPVRDADFTYIYDYRPAGGTQNYDAPKPQIDQLLGFLEYAKVVTVTPGNKVQEGPSVVELVPEIAELKAA